MKLYDAPACPFCARVRIALAEKGLAFDRVEINLRNRPSWLRDLNPAGKVPVFDDDGFVLPESAVIMEYLEERYPEPALLAADPADRALARLRIFRQDEVTSPYYALRRGEDDARARLDKQLARLDTLLTATPWLGGREYGLADIAFVPWILRSRDMLGVGLDPYPALQDWLERLEERPAVAAESALVAAL